MPDKLRSQRERGFQFSVVAVTAREQTDQATPFRKSRRKVCNSVKVPSPPGTGEKVADRPDEGVAPLSLSRENC